MSDRLNKNIQSCQCKSLFTIGACGVQELFTLKPGDKHWKNDLQRLEDIRKGIRKRSYTDMLQELSRHFSQHFTFERNIQENKTLWYIKNEFAPSPFLLCQERTFLPAEVSFCLENFRSRNKFEQPMKIVFMGDSRSRFLMKHFLKIVESSLKVDFDNHRKLKLLYTERFKYDLNISFPSLETSLIWTPYFEEYKVKETLKLWCQSPNEDLPSLLVVSFGNWPAVFHTNINAIDDYINTLTKYKELFSCIAKKLPVLWLLEAPVKLFKTFDDSKANPPLDFTNTLSWKFFQDTEIIIWDTKELLSIRELDECEELKEAGFDLDIPEEWLCWDRYHAGSWVNNWSANRLLQLLCGSTYTDVNSSYCCY